MKIVIIEDEKLAAANLVQMIHQIDSTVEVVDIIESVRNAVLWFQMHEVDLVFMDIHLSDGICFNIFEQVSVSTPVIFTTAYDQYALKAFKINCIDYLLKPIDPTELERSINKYKTFFTQNTQQSVPDFKQLLAAFSSKTEYQKRFMVFCGQKIKSIKAEEIAYFSVTEKNVLMTTFDGHSYGIEHTLDTLETMIDPDGFFRVNRQFIVNFESIQNMYPMSKSRLRLELKPHTQEEVTVSLQRMVEFRRWIGSR